MRHRNLQTNKNDGVTKKIRAQEQNRLYTLRATPQEQAHRDRLVRRDSHKSICPHEPHKKNLSFPETFQRALIAFKPIRNPTKNFLSRSCKCNFNLDKKIACRRSGVKCAVTLAARNNWCRTTKDNLSPEAKPAAQVHIKPCDFQKALSLSCAMRVIMACGAIRT